MKNKFKKAVLPELQRIRNLQNEILTDPDMEHLPPVVKKYIHYTGFPGKEKVRNFRSTFTGGIRFHPDKEYKSMKSVQYNFMDKHSRFFHIVAKKKNIPATSLHIYQHAKATFTIKLLGLFTVLNAKGPEMDQGETVTVLNDMCFMAPGALIDKKIQWEVMDNQSVKATFTNLNITVSAILYFDDEGKLINFVSNDRFETTGKEYHNYPWETPVTAYREFEGLRLPSKANLIYRRPKGDFCYGKFELDTILYNCIKFT